MEQNEKSLNELVADAEILAKQIEQRIAKYIAVKRVGIHIGVHHLSASELLQLAARLDKGPVSHEWYAWQVATTAGMNLTRGRVEVSLYTDDVEPPTGQFPRADPNPVCRSTGREEQREAKESEKATSAPCDY